MQMHEVLQALADAKTTLQRADSVATDLLKLLRGRLRHVGTDYTSRTALADLKRELRDFNITTRRWNKTVSYTHLTLPTILLV